MEKGAPPSLFVNDGSFMERFKQLQGSEAKGVEKGKSVEEKDSNPKPVVTGKPIAVKTSFQLKSNSKVGTSATASGGKLAFSLKQKSKLVTPVKLGEDEEEEADGETGSMSSDLSLAKRQRLGQPDGLEQASNTLELAPPSPSDPTVKKVADKLASFVAKNGREFENITRQKNPGDTPFKFLFDKSCPEYRYYEYRLSEEEKNISQTNEPQTPSISTPQPHVNYQTPASALYDAPEDPATGESGSLSSSDSLAMMEFYMKKAAREEKRKAPKLSNDEMPPPPSLLSSSSKRGHHMGDYIPQEELEKFLATCNDANAVKATKETAERAKIQADNVGHKLLSKMGWREGEGLGSSGSGISDPIKAGNIKQDHLGVGAHQPGEVTAEDDIYEQYKKRMMLGYRYRPNPLNNPRKAYY